MLRRNDWLLLIKLLNLIAQSFAFRKQKRKILTLPISKTSAPETSINLNLFPQLVPLVAYWWYGMIGCYMVNASSRINFLYPSGSHPSKIIALGSSLISMGHVSHLRELVSLIGSIIFKCQTTLTGLLWGISITLDTLITEIEVMVTSTI